MKLTNNPKRIEIAHYILQKLEDEVVGYTTETKATTVEECERIFIARLDEVHNKVCAVIQQLNEAYDEAPL